MPTIILPVLDTTSIGWIFSPPISASAAVLVQESITVTTGGILLVNDSAAPGVNQYYGTDSGGIKGYHAITSAAGGQLTVEETDLVPTVHNVVTIRVPVDSLTDDGGGQVTLSFITTSGPTLRVEEIDGTPNVFPVSTIRVSNGVLTDDGGGQVTLAISAGGGGLTLIEHKLLTTNTTTATFSGLDGDTDGVYLLVGMIVAGPSGSGNIQVNPNGVTSNQSTGQFVYNFFGSGAGAGSNWICFNGSLSSGKFGFFSAQISARKVAHSVTRRRFFQVQSTEDSSSNATGFLLNGRWDETSTNITSLDVAAQTANGLGDGTELWLYKYQQ